jgi:DNA-3-methyladenine glycosylase II
MPGLDAAEIKAARATLAGLDPALARANAATPDFPWRTRDGGYAGLLRILVNQQVSNASAAAIWDRLEAGLGQVTAETVLRFDIDSLKRFGLSRPKARYALAIAEAERNGAIDFARLGELDDGAALSALCSLIGVGRWTAEVYLSVCEGRLDFFPAGDVALQEALRLADRSERRLTEKQLYQRAERWRPHRGVAAHLLWAYYGGVKRGEIDPG